MNRPSTASAAAPDRSRLRRYLATAAGAVLSLAAVAFFQRALTGAVADPDSFYHLGHAAAYLDGSIFDTAFPWGRYSVIGAAGADLWWGYHVLLLPFAGTGSLPAAITAAGMAFTTMLCLGVLWLALRHRWVWPWMWPVFFLVAVPNVLYRLLMVRPHVLSLLAALVLSSALSRRDWRLAALASGLLTWVHASIFWVPFVVLGAFGLAALADRRWAVGTPEPIWPGAAAPLGAVAGGAAAGLLLRPHPLATVKLIYVQIFQLFGERAEGLPLSFGGELIPLPVQALGPSAWLVLVPWVLALLFVGAAAWKPDGRLRELSLEDRLLMVGSGVLSLAFLGVTLVLAGRAIVEWAAFATIFMAMAWSRIPASPGRRSWATGMTGLVALLALPWVSQWHALNVRLNALPDDHLQQAATWIQERSSEGDVVFHAHWDNFAALYGWNRQNNYLGGMDPIFQLAFDGDLYWKHAHLAGGAMTATTCGSFPCEPGTEEDTHTVMVEDFDARWVLVEPMRNPALFDYLAADPRFDLSLRTRREAVFQVLR